MPPLNPELLARFLVEKHFSVEKDLVKPGAFLPELYEGVFVTSVFDIDGLSDEQRWAVGQTHVAVPRGKHFYGHAEFRHGAAVEVGLGFRSAEPPPRHGELVGWSTDKGERLLTAQELAANSLLKLKP